jgi:murein DD-endopeptidase MepM/ murein hydrolase activator NlpD
VSLLALAVLIELIPTSVPQGQVAHIKAASSVSSVRLKNRNIPLFPATDGTRFGLLPIPALDKPGPIVAQAIDSNGQVVGSVTITVTDAKFKTQNVVLGKALTALKPAPGEMETVAALRNTVTPERHWSEPFEIPVPGCMTSPFGVLRLHNGKPTGNYHSGIDQRGAEGTPIRAISGGIVKIVRKFNVHGDLVGIDHGQGVTSFYLHMSKFAVAEGAAVNKGDVIGYVGSTGRSTAPHLHWGLDVMGTPVNPSQWIQFDPCPVPAPAKRRTVKRKR